MGITVLYKCKFRHQIVELWRQSLVIIHQLILAVHRSKLKLNS